MGLQEKNFKKGFWLYFCFKFILSIFFKRSKKLKCKIKTLNGAAALMVPVLRRNLSEYKGENIVYQ